MRHGDRVKVEFSGTYQMGIKITNDGQFTNVIEILTDTNQRMIIPEEYVTINENTNPEKVA